MLRYSEASGLVGARSFGVPQDACPQGLRVDDIDHFSFIKRNCTIENAEISAKRIQLIAAP